MQGPRKQLATSGSRINRALLQNFTDRARLRKDGGPWRWSVGACGDASRQDLAHVRVVLGNQLLLHRLKLRLELLIAHGGDRKCLDLVQEAED